MKTLSLCMITKNEEKNISRCLDSIKDIVDEIIIVDTGSTDKTIEIAKSYGANIYHYEWSNDFSKARNVSLQKATKDWILVLDADEVLPYEEGLKLKNIINTSVNEGLFLRLDNIIENVNLGDAVVLRAFKNNPKYRFRGSMHEQVIFSIEEVSGKDKIQPTNVKITHYGYDPNVCDMEEKQKRNLSILESYPQEDRDGYFYYSLGNEYSRIKEYDKAIDVYKKALDYTRDNYVDTMPSYLSYLVVNLSKTYSALKKYKEAISILESFQKKYPDFRDLYFLEALYKMECGKFSEAKESLLKYLNTDYSFYIFPDNNYEESYNMGILLRDIRKSSVSSPKNLLSVLFLDGNYDDTLLLGIQSVNEIASEVLVCLPSSSVIDKNVIENYGANIISLKDYNGEESLIKGLTSCSSKYILILKSREFISKDLFAPLVNFLETTNDDFCNVLVSDKSQVPQLRLLRNTNKIKNMKNINDFYKVLENQNIQTYDININKA